ncbi:hypothetical protein KB206_10835 [Microvirga sp. STS02]|uniref:hypothetical protein n=1 Tax=Hymenobacter negativus TaxID=2795026 RepID=UPI001B827100|nr:MULTISPECIES: hypothetical protein [Bacteria]MBR7209116.1 hypothetical protein [Microvirga sp. STS02]
MSAETKAPKTTSKAPAAKAKVESYDIARSNETQELAKDLARFIKENKLSTQVQGKDFVNVEGWQYAGSRLGIVPVVEHVINVSTDTELRYQAKVTLYDLNHAVTVGAGFAVCSNKESGKKFYQEFAIMSMAQTRAVGKAYRNVLAWIIRAAGYEPTPAEEMDYNTNTASAAPVANPTPGSSGGNSTALPAASATSAPKALPEMRVVGTDEVTDPAVPVQFATTSQKEEIIRLLNHPVITRPEKTKMLLNINRLDEERAVQAIAKLRKAIDDRENGEGGNDWRTKLKKALEENSTRIPKAEAQELAAMAYDENATGEALRDALHRLNQLLADSAA